MKRIKYILLIAIVALFNYSCEDDKDIATLDNEGAVASTLLTPAAGSSYTMDKAQGEEMFELITWTESDYGAVLSRDYTIQLDVTDGQFTDPVKIIRVDSLSYSITNAAFNLFLYDGGARAGVSSNAWFRIMTTVRHDAPDTLYSVANEISATIFDYNKPNLNEPAAGKSFVLNFADAEKDFETFIWDKVDYGSEDYAGRFTLELDLAGNNFSKPKNLGTVAGLVSNTPVVEDVNSALLKLGVTPGVATDIEFRVVAAAGNKSGIVYGDPVTYTFTAYDEDNPGGGDVVDPLYLVGSATIPGWDAGNGIPILWDEATSTYTVITDFVDGGMKILEVAGQWAPQWGDDGSFSGILSYRPDEATADPAEIPSPGTGSYKLIVDIDNLTYAFEAQ